MIGIFRARKKTKRAKILIVDDEVDLVKAVQWMLKSYDYDIVSAPNGIEGLRVAASEKPDLIVLDIKMPLMNGHEMLKNLRKDPALKNIPVIICTVSNEVQDIAAASGHNICDYITKPFDCSQLLGRISNALTKRGA
jgi:two-component system alkaline phosphatase synthesis response regulator PhoP